MTLSILPISFSVLFLLLFLFSPQHPRYKLLRYSKERQYIDGLNNLISAPSVLVDRLYTNISVNLTPELAPIEDYWGGHTPATWTATLTRSSGCALQGGQWVGVSRPGMSSVTTGWGLQQPPFSHPETPPTYTPLPPQQALQRPGAIAKPGG